MTKDLPDSARVVIIGGGIAGASVAYHLTQLGWTDLVVLERRELTGGTTWHAAGLVTQLRASQTLIELARDAVDLYSTLEAETGQSTGFQQTGSVTVARTQARMDELRHIVSLGRVFGIEIHEISPREAGERLPLIVTDDLVGALYIPKDGQAVPGDAAMAMAKAAMNAGAQFFEETKVTGIHQREGAVASVSTPRGDIECEYLVNCAGMWAREVGQMCGVAVPLQAAEHMYVITNPMGVPPAMHCLRDPDGEIYFRRDIEEKGAILMGGFEPVAKPWGMDGIPDDHNFSLLEPEWGHFRRFWDAAIQRMPSIEEAGVDRFNVGAESFTPDNMFIMGEAPEVKHFFVAAGLNSTGISNAPGIGKAVAEWIVEGVPRMDLTEVDIRRFHGMMNNKKYLYDRTIETVGTVYGMHWPQREFETARKARRSALHDRLETVGACFGVSAGWERANWFAPEGVEPKDGYSFGRPNWFPYTGEEHRAVRETVGLFDQSSFAKFLVQGRDSEAVLQHLCANDLGVEPGTVVYTGMLNEGGGFEADVTVTRMAENEFMVVTGGSTATRTMNWMRRNISDDAHVFLTDQTSAFGVLGLMGPNSRELLSAVTDTDLSNEACPYLSSSEIEIGYAPVRATRITYVGELGWELHVPTEFMVHVYDAIVGASDEFGLRHAGYRAMESLRTEKGYRAWGADITDQETPLEAGLGFAVAFDKSFDFIGRDALLRQRENGLNRRMVMFTLDDSDPYLLGNEPIFRDGEVVGRITSGYFGYTVGRSVGMGYVSTGRDMDASDVRSGSYELELSTERFSATASLRPPYDPRGDRVRG